MTIVFVVSCVMMLIMLGILVVGVIMVVQASRRDGVSSAREDWIGRRSEQDKRDW